MIIRNLLAGILIAVSAVCTPAMAIESSSPIGLGLFPPIQFPNTEYGIKGIRLGLVGVNREMRGLDIGLLGNVTKQTFKGLAIAGLFNYNQVSSTVVGLQVAALANINGPTSKLYGIQLGLVNKVAKVYGLQLGLINMAHELHGVQIGLLNFNASGPFTATPIINAAF